MKPTDKKYSEIDFAILFTENHSLSQIEHKRGM